MGNNVKNKTNLTLIIAGATMLLALCLLILFGIIHKPILLRSDQVNIIYITEKDEAVSERITYLTVEGKFPYLSIVPSLPEQRTTNSERNVTEIYKIKGKFYFNQRTSMTLDIMSSNDTVYTYILQFADKNITIHNGKAAEQ